MIHAIGVTLVICAIDKETNRRKSTRCGVDRSSKVRRIVTTFVKTEQRADVLFQLRFSRKQLERESKRSEKEMNVQKAKVKKVRSLMCGATKRRRNCCLQSLQNGDVESARIYAENAIRKKNESLNYLRFAGKIDAVASRVQSAVSVQNVCSRDLSGVIFEIALLLR